MTAARHRLSRAFGRASALVACGFLVATSAIAVPRTFVASWGNDANACSRSAPCRSFQIAIDGADAGGEVVALDSGGYGQFGIEKSLSIVVPGGVHAGITVIGGVGVDINIAPTDSVLLRGLALNVTPPSVAGIKLTSAGALAIDHCTLNGMPNSGDGILVSGAEAGQEVRLTVSDTTVRGFRNSVFLRGPGTFDALPADASVEIRDSSFVDSQSVALNLQYGQQRTELAIQRSVTAHGFHGLWFALDLSKGTGPVNAVVEDVLVGFNSGAGVGIQGRLGGRPRVTLSGNAIVGNFEGLFVESTMGSGDIIGFTRLDNTMRENGSDILIPPLGPVAPL